MSLLARLSGVLFLLVRRRLKLEPVQIFLLGCVLAALGATLLFDQPGTSQINFLRTVYPLGALLSVWGLVELVPASRLKPTVVWGLVGAVVAAAVLLGFYITFGAPSPSGVGRRNLADALVTPVLVIAGVAVAAVVGWLVLRRKVRGLMGLGAALACAVLMFSLGAPTFPVDLRPATEHLFTTGLPALTPSLQSHRPMTTTADEVRAARWIAHEAGRDDIVATNVHCVFDGQDGSCETRMFLVSAFTERSVLVGSWAYSNLSLSNNGKGGLPFNHQPFWNKKLLTANDRAFTNPSPELLKTLRDKNHVRWLYADPRAGAVSPMVDRYATLRHVEGNVRVYELR